MVKVIKEDHDMLGRNRQKDRTPARHQPAGPWNLSLCAVLVVASIITFALGTVGCVNVKAPEQVYVERHRPVDASQVPPTSSHEEARQRLGEAYGEIRHLQARNNELERDRSKLRRELEDCRDGRKHSDHDD
jgi:hypothetical protein